MLLNKQERKHKRFIAVQKEFNLLLEAERKLPWTEVKPYQDGWFIHIEFKDEIRRRSDYPFLLEVLNLVARRGRTRDPKLVNRLRHTKRLDQAYRLFPDLMRWSSPNMETYMDYVVHQSRWNYGNVAPALGRTTPEKYDKLHPSAKKWFTKYEDGKMSCFHSYGRVYYKASFPDGWLRMKVRPAYVTHVKDIDPQLMKRQKEVQDEMNFLGWDFYTKGNWGHYSHHYENRARRAHDRASLRAIVKGEKEDFEHLRKNVNYD